MGAPAQQAPSQVEMGDGVIVYQNTNNQGRCCCCQPNIEWSIHEFAEDFASQPLDERLRGKLLSIKEDASWCGRCWSLCWPGWRATRYTAQARGPAQGPALVSFEKPPTCSHCPLCPSFYMGWCGPVRCPWCCCLPYL